MNNLDYKKTLRRLLAKSIERKASDLHISANHYPVLRVSGKLQKLRNERELTPQDTEGLANSLMNDFQLNELKEKKEVDFSYNFEDRARFRVNVFYQSGNISCALRRIPAEIKTIEELNLPPVLHRFSRATQGFFLVTGPSGHGKSTTLAALIEEINHERADHVITIEDPIEYVFSDDKAIIDQREVYKDTLSFSKALRSTFRQDPDVIMVGEMRDKETISTAITAAETGHLVFATLHTNSASQTIHRIVDTFPSEEQNQIRAQLSTALLGVVSERLLPSKEEGLVPACEVLLGTPAVENLIRENKVHEIPLVIETSREAGMISLNSSLADLVKEGKVKKEIALSYSIRPDELRMLLED